MYIPRYLLLQTWYGICFTADGHATAQRPLLPRWAEEMLDDDASDADMHAAMTGRGYAGARLEWIRYVSDDHMYYGMAVAETVQSSPGGPGVVKTCLRAAIADEWSRSLGRAFAILELPAAEADWYQSVFYRMPQARR